jgi:hypothetical protein
VGRHALTTARLADERAFRPYPDRVEILWWLAPPVVATVLAMCWVSWLGRAGRGQIDPDVAAQRLGDAMARPTRVSRAPARRPSSPEERGTGVAVRPSSRTSGTTRRAS